MENKPFYLSKTLWVNVLAVLGLVIGGQVPVVGEFIKQYFSELGAGWAVVNTVLRLISKDKLSLG